MSFLTEQFANAGLEIEEYSFFDYIDQSFGTSSMLELPAQSSLPQPIQDFLSDLDTVETDHEKLNLIHDFVGDYMTYTPEADLIPNVREVLKDAVGDCDDYAMLTAGLLRYAGFKENDIYLVGAQISYVTDDATETTPHAVVILRKDDQAYFIDMNLKDPVVMDNRGSAEAVIVNGVTDEEYNGTAQIDSVLFMMNMSGRAWQNDGWLAHGSIQSPQPTPRVLEPEP